MVNILCGKSSCGKDSIKKGLIDRGYKGIVSYTSRDMRVGEVEGREYHFISKEQFIEDINNDMFLEYRTYNTLFNGIPDVWYYGTRKQPLTISDDYVIILDIDGARKFVDYYGKDLCNVFYIDVDDNIRTERAKCRGSFDETEWNRRMLADDKDFSYNNRKNIVNYIINNNKDNNLDNIVNNIYFLSSSTHKK